MLDPLSFSIEPPPRVSPRLDLPVRKLLQPSPDHPDDYIMELDYSHGLSNFMICPRLWENINVRSREAAYDNIAQSFGTLFHKCEELRLRHGLSPEVIARQREVVVQHFLAAPAPAGEYRTADRMLAVLNKYNTGVAAHDHWPESIAERDGEKVLERSFKVPLCSIKVLSDLPYYKSQLVASSTDRERVGGLAPIKGFFVRFLHILLTGRIDAILQNSNLLFVLDHKTTSRDESSVVEAFNLSFQTRGYAWAARELGFPVAGCIINSILIRPPAKTERAQKPREEFNRYTYFYRPDQLDEFAASAKAHIETLVHFLTTGFFPQTSLSFMSPCPRCDFHDNCRLPPYQREADLQSDLYRDVTWDPTHERE